jgi:hypothetical protein
VVVLVGGGPVGLRVAEEEEGEHGEGVGEGLLRRSGGS